MSSGADNVNINLRCLIVPCGELHTLSRDQVEQIVTVSRSQAVSDLEAIIRNRLGAPFNSIRLKIRQVYPRVNNLEKTISMSSLNPSQDQNNFLYHVLAIYSQFYVL
jgi:hypothetical protein